MIMHAGPGASRPGSSLLTPGRHACGAQEAGTALEHAHTGAGRRSFSPEGLVSVSMMMRQGRLLSR